MSKTIESDDAIPHSDGTVLSLIGQNAENDFPVLKAFQQYIDAEQAKARKRMLGLSIFFIMLLVAVVVTFTIVIMSVINRNQALSDRLLEIALRERPAQAAPVVVQQPAPQPIVQHAPVQSRDSELKPFLDKMETLISAIVAKQQQQLAPAPVVVTTGTPMQTIQPSAESSEAARMREELKKQKEELEAERARLKEAQEKLKQAEIEKHRRRLYPEYYAQEDARKMVPASVPTPAPVTPPPQVVAPAVDAPAPVAAPAPAPVVPVQPAPKARPAAAPAPAPARAPTSLANLKPINYFEQSDDTPPAKPAAKPAEKPAQKPVAPAAKQPAQTTKPAPKAPMAKPATPAAKPVAKPVEKPAPKPAAKPTSPTPPPPSQPKAKSPEVPKTETIDVGTPSGNATPWLIEQQDL